MSEPEALGGALADSKSIVHLLSDYVMETLEAIGIPEAQINNELAGRMEFIDTVDRAEDLMVHLGGIAHKIINKKSLEGAFEPT